MKSRGSPSEFLANLRQPLPLAAKLRDFVRNRRRALVRGGCCGHPGAPGC